MRNTKDWPLTSRSLYVRVQFGVESCCERVCAIGNTKIGQDLDASAIFRCFSLDHHYTLGILVSRRLMTGVMALHGTCGWKMSVAIE